MTGTSETAIRETEDIAAEAELDRRIEEILDKSHMQPQHFRYRSQRLGVLAQPLRRGDAKISNEERKLVVKLLLLYHLTTGANADCMDEIMRVFYRDWPIAQVAAWKYGPPESDTMRDRHEKRVRDTLKHNLKSLRSALVTKFHITAARQV